MKVFKNLMIATLAICSFLLAGCEDYLNIPPEADISEEEIFGTYETFQGFQDRLAARVASAEAAGQDAAQVGAAEAGTGSNPTE